jgi:hypothetical protein
MKVCISGAATDSEGVCLEHGETACVVELAASTSTGERPDARHPTDSRHLGVR